ncbi:hypothetical protein IW261DRAFT_932063 [Armillaria novae-zelandiae]|uniref:Uncharacterized protein n=1 Tax=Armillaria novae-zelandiae TaxID=153914 RepID=A0AA39UL22_9AGAR|nr:hypothetical protein IW261DRAFT_932063 [Armillaria novae-zelandiae]
MRTLGFCEESVIEPYAERLPCDEGRKLKSRRERDKSRIKYNGKTGRRPGRIMLRLCHPLGASCFCSFRTKLALCRPGDFISLVHHSGRLAWNADHSGLLWTSGKRRQTEVRTSRYMEIFPSSGFSLLSFSPYGQACCIFGGFSFTKALGRGKVTMLSSYLERSSQACGKNSQPLRNPGRNCFAMATNTSLLKDPTGDSHLGQKLAHQSVRGKDSTARGPMIRLFSSVLRSST